MKSVISPLSHHLSENESKIATSPQSSTCRGSPKTLGLDHLTLAQRIALHDFDLGVWYNVNWDQTPTEPYEKLITFLESYIALAALRPYANEVIVADS